MIPDGFLILVLCLWISPSLESPSLVANVEHAMPPSNVSYNSMFTISAVPVCARSCLATNCGLFTANIPRIYKVAMGGLRRRCVCKRDVDADVVLRHSSIIRVTELPQLRLGKICLIDDVATEQYGWLHLDKNNKWQCHEK